MAVDDELKGVGGWLAFFLVTLGIITPAFNFISVAMLMNEPDMNYAAILFPALLPAEWALAVVMSLLCWFAMFRFLKVENWTTVRIGIATLWTIALLSVVGEPVMVSAITGLGLGDVYAAAAGPELIRPFIYCTIWTAYLLKSERVRNTYAGRSSGETAEVFA